MKKALLIGINYTDIPGGVPLKGCINDAITMRNMLIDAYDYDDENILMLRDDDSNKFLRPTHNNIYDSIIQLVLESGNLDEIWLHYSGHGSTLQKQDSSETIEILVPVDYKTAGCISDMDLYDIVRRIKCRAILTFDCCHSGTVCDLQYTIEYKDGTLTSNRMGDIMIKNPNIFMISGCRDDQISVDTTNEMDQRSGAFTNAFCECLRNSRHNTSILSLYENICIYLAERGYSQTPVLSATVKLPNHMFAKEGIDPCNGPVESFPQKLDPSTFSPIALRKLEGRSDFEVVRGRDGMLRILKPQQLTTVPTEGVHSGLTDMRHKYIKNESRGWLPAIPSGLCRHFYTKR